MRFDLLGFAAKRQDLPPNIIGIKPLNFHFTVFHINTEKKVDRLNPMQRRNWSLVMIAKNQHLWHVELFAWVFRDDAKKLFRAQLMKDMAKAAKSAPTGPPKETNFTKRVKAMARGKF
jgi:hypothetical protein